MVEDGIEVLQPGREQRRVRPVFKLEGVFSSVFVVTGVGGHVVDTEEGFEQDACNSEVPISTA